VNVLETRRMALELAIEALGEHSNDRTLVIKTANEFYSFLMGERSDHSKPKAA